MKIETILNAMMKVNNNLILVGPLHLLVGPHRHKHLVNLRQYYAFRDRIIRMDKEKDQTIRWMEHDLNLWRKESKNED